MFVSLMMVVASYYMFVMKAKPDGVVDDHRATPARPVHDEARGGPRISPRSPSRRRSLGGSPESEVQRKKMMRSVLVQGPVTYKSRSKDHSSADGRYAPLSAQDWGAWTDI